VIPEQTQLSALALPSSITVVLGALVPNLVNSSCTASELNLSCLPECVLFLFLSLHFGSCITLKIISISFVQFIVLFYFRLEFSVIPALTYCITDLFNYNLLYSGITRFLVPGARNHKGHP
jgi:hypothetical protein